MLTRTMVSTMMGLPYRCSADNREEGGTNGTSGSMGIKETKEPSGTNGVILREPTVVAGGPLGAGDKAHGGKHGESRIVSTTRGTAWEGMYTAIVITRG